MVVIYTYTRKQAIEDGVLVDVSSLAKEAGLRWPAAVTATVWEKYVAVPPDVSGQDEDGRLWDILWMFRFRDQVLRDSPLGSEWLFKLFVQNDDKEPPEEVTLKAHCGAGDDAEPVITVMLPHED